MERIKRSIAVASLVKFSLLGWRLIVQHSYDLIDVKVVRLFVLSFSQGSHVGNRQILEISRLLAASNVKQMLALCRHDVLEKLQTVLYFHL